MRTLINNIDLISGDSSDIHYFSSPDFSDFSSADWVGSATIRDTDINGAINSTIPLTKNDGSDGTPANSRFVFKISPTESAALVAGEYSLSIEVKNLVIGFRREIVQAGLTVTVSGVLN